MTLFVQGMRRSGTTILYDALVADPGLRCFYEPLREEGETVGGGSGARDADAFAETRELRRRFRDEHHPELPIEEFNWGGPREPELELGPELPDHCRGFLAHLLEQAPEVAIKFTRMYDKVGVLAELDPEAVLVHVVRDPRAVIASMMLGRDRRHADRYEHPDDFFGERERRKLWSSRQLSRTLLRRPEYRSLRRPTNVVRIAVVWSYTFRTTFREGRRRFGDRYVLLRNEDLRTDPGAALSRIYGALGRSVPDEVDRWAADNVREPEAPYAAEDPRWVDLLGRLGIGEELEVAGYGELAEAIAERRGPQRLRGFVGRTRERIGSRGEGSADA